MPAKPLTEEQKEDSAKLMVIFKSKSGLTQAQLADDLGFANQSAVSQYLNGKIPLNVEVSVKFAKRFDCDVSRFSPSLQREIDRIASFASKIRDEKMNPLILSKEELAERREKGHAHQNKVDPNDLVIQAGVDVTNKFLVATRETQEVINYFLLEDGKEKPVWADSDARAYAEALQYKAHKWISGGEKKTG